MSNLPFFIAILTVPALALFAEATIPESSQLKSSISIEQDNMREPTGVEKNKSDYQIIIRRDQNNTSILNFNLVNAASEEAPLSCQWNLGDGATYTGQNINHLYTVPGIYHVELSILGRDGLENSYTTNIQVPGGDLLQPHTAFSNVL